MMNQIETTRMVRALPHTRSAVVVHSSARRNEIMGTLIMERGADAVKMTAIFVCRTRNLALINLTGLRIPVVIDHEFAYNVPVHLDELVEQMALGCNIVARRAAS